MSEGRQGVRRGPVSATEAAFAGFSLVRERPGAFGAIVLVSALFYLLILWVQVEWILPPMMRLVQAQQAAAADPAQADPMASLSMFGEIFPYQLLLLAASALFGAVINAGVYRAILRPRERGFGSLRLGTDELRQFGLLLQFILLFFGLYIASIILAVVFGIAAALIGAAAGGGGGFQGGGWYRLALILTVVVSILLPMLIVGVRLALCGPLTFARRRLQLFAAWRVTRGRFWTILGAYVVALMIMLIVSLIFFLVVGMIGIVVGGGFRSMFINPRDLATGLTLTPMMIVWMLANAPLAALWYCVFAGVAANLYLQIAGGPNPAFDGPDRSHSFGAGPALAPVPPPPDTEYPITPPRSSPPDAL